MKKSVIIILVLLIAFVSIIVVINNIKPIDKNVGIEGYLYEKFGDNYVILEKVKYGGGEGELKGNIYYVKHNNENYIVYTQESLLKETKYFSYVVHLEENNNYLYCNPPEGYAVMVIKGDLNKYIDIISNKIESENMNRLFVYSFNDIDINSNYFRLLATSGAKISFYEINKTNKVYQRLNYSMYSFNNSNKDNLSLKQFLVNNIENY